MPLIGNPPWNTWRDNWKETSSEEIQDYIIRRCFAELATGATQFPDDVIWASIAFQSSLQGGRVYSHPTLDKSRQCYWNGERYVPEESLSFTFILDSIIEAGSDIVDNREPPHADDAEIVSTVYEEFETNELAVKGNNGKWLYDAFAEERDFESAARVAIERWDMAKQVPTSKLNVD